MTDSHHNHAAELEREALIKECHSLIALIANKAYSNKLLKAAKAGLTLISQYKSNRGER